MQMENAGAMDDPKRVWPKFDRAIHHFPSSVELDTKMDVDHRSAGQRLSVVVGCVNGLVCELEDALPGIIPILVSPWHAALASPKRCG